MPVWPAPLGGSSNAPPVNVSGSSVGSPAGRPWSARVWTDSVTPLGVCGRSAAVHWTATRVVSATEAPGFTVAVGAGVTTRTPAAGPSRR
ncbi:hypothetical protein ACFQ9X_05455 [Catenulispora yoronensis]